ncbi:hypothetical protein TSUD_303670 [Trifolium subterraneum]|uniref:Peptidase A1 domain-containing protein n=1 Tax=Trifolium subterraneum TaxID=3900 RepID=A0A2Z6LNU5_TRISU|nr:hypothetical protein TSUD_303670 [Trifolium subterraneum]
MKLEKLGFFIVLLFLSSSTSLAWFGNSKNKISTSNGRNSILPYEQSSSSSSSSSPPSFLNRFRSGSSVVFPVHGNVYPVGYTPHPLYRPSNDLVPCRHPMCASVHQTNNYDCEVEHQCDYEVEYADHYSSLGVLVNDVYVLNFTNGVQLKVRMALGCGYDQIFPDSSYHPIDGMLGLGRGKSSLISQLNNQGLVRNVVGHCLSAQGGGYIFFGDVYDSSRLAWTPMSSRDSKHYSAGAGELTFGGKRTGFGNLLAVFDTGSSYTYFNSNTYQALISWLTKELAGKPIKEAPEDQTLPLCWYGKRPFRSVYEVRKYFKPIALSFPSSGKIKAQFEIPPEAYLIISNMGNVCLGILNGSEVGMEGLNLIGDISMLDKVMVFDNEKQLIGWAPADCNRVPKSRDVSI